jgi:hypothetical protein
MRHYYTELSAEPQLGRLQALGSAGPWRVTCTINHGEFQRTFPSEEFGVGFARKKDAKRYAAKLAYESLMQGANEPDSRLAAPDQDRATAATAAVPAAKRKREDKIPPATEQITRLCAKLGVKAPQYAFTGEPGQWNGRLIFGHDQDVPLGLGTVSNIYEKEEAKKIMADAFLQWLIEIDEDRDRKWRSLVGDEAS